jgi:hypothetical protein
VLYICVVKKRDVTQVQELTDDNDELNMLVKKASGVAGSKGGGSSRMSVYGGGGIKSEGSFDMSKSRMRYTCICMYTCILVCVCVCVCVTLFFFYDIAWRAGG